MMDKELALFEDFLLKIDKKIPFMGMNPLNAISERKKFLKNPAYVPVFRYAKPPSGIEKLFGKIENIELEENIINNLYLQKLEKYKRTNAMLQNIGTDEFTFFSKQIFGEPSVDLVNKAYIILEKEPFEEEASVTPKQVCEVIRKVFEEFNLKDWVVSTKKMTANAAIYGSRKRVYVKKNAKFPEGFMKRVIVHEIGSHAFRAENGARQPYTIFRRGLPNYLMTEEGMAVNAEEMNECLNINTLRVYAGRVIAIHHSLEKGFREVFDELRKYFDEYQAWKITLRAKRGLSDQTKPGAYTKDYLYLHGYYEVKKFLEENGNKGLRQLYYGKVGLEHVPLMDKIEGLKEPELVPVSKKFRKMLKEVSL